LNCEEMSLAVWPPLLLLCSMALTTSPPAFEITAGHQIVADDLCPGVDRVGRCSGSIVKTRPPNRLWVESG
ncbi:hypothetical protein T4E_3931, partial [Trichinella pseudospiralis]